MPERTLEVRNPSGLHARPAASFVKAASGFRSDLRLANLDRDAAKVVSAKSVLGVMGAGVSRGHRIRILAEGEDADAALDALEALVASGLGEPIDAP